MLRNIEDIVGYDIQARDGSLGQVEDFFFDGNTWAIRYLVVRTGPWFFGKNVLISPHAVRTIDIDEEAVAVNLTQEQIKNGPDVDLARPLSRQQMINLHEYYNWPRNWLDPDAMRASYGPPVLPMPHEIMAVEAEKADENVDADANVQSAGEIMGYAAEAIDGSIGSISTFVFDDEKWQIRYVVVDVGSWLPGRQVLVVPHWLQRIDHKARTAHINLHQHTIEDSPDFDPAQPIDDSISETFDEFMEGEAA